MFVFETLKVVMYAPHICILTLNRPQFANAFNTQMVRDLINFFEEITLSEQEIRVIVMRGAGDSAFCSGGDLKERNHMTNQEWQSQHLLYERMVRAILACPIPLLGAINGAAYGGGCELAAACDFLYASEDATFAQTEVKLGIIPGAGGTQLLTRAIGERRAKEMIFTGNSFSAQQAYEWGLVNAIYPITSLMTEVLSIAQKIARNAPIAVRQAKQAITRGLDMGIAAGLAFEIEAYNRTVVTQDRQEGILAFNEKRKPKFKGL